MSHIKKILILGATGYLGGTLLDAIWKYDLEGKFDIVAYVRSSEKAKKCEELAGLKTFSGSVADVEKAAAEVDIVLNIASSDDLPLTEAVLKGAKVHYETTKVPTEVLHVSGTGIVTNNEMGHAGTYAAFDDADSGRINALPANAWHRNVDTALINAHNEGYIKSYINYPSFIFGQGTGKLVDLGIQFPSPTAIAIIARFGISRGAFGGVGPMRNSWGVVHVHDVVDLLMLMFEAIDTGKIIPSGPDGHYFATNGHLVADQYNPATAKALYELGALKTPEVIPYTDEDYAKAPYLTVFGTTSLTTASRSRSIGWKPKHPPEDFFTAIKESMRVLVEWDKNH